MLASVGSAPRVPVLSQAMSLPSMQGEPSATEPMNAPVAAENRWSTAVPGMYTSVPAGLSRMSTSRVSVVPVAKGEPGTGAPVVALNSLMNPSVAAKTRFEAGT